MSCCPNILRLIRSPGIGPVTFHGLMGKCGTAKEALRFLKAHNRELCEEALVEMEIRASKKMGVTLLDFTHASYPAMIKNLNDFPPVLSVLGNLDILENSPAMVGIVGSRGASLHGKHFAEQLATTLGKFGYIIVSGLARGIDGAAHRGALDTGTIAVVAGGVDKIYPPEHKNLREEIMKKGIILSEMPLGLFPGAKHFPRRNRLISALSKGVCIIEAAKPSGSLITANFALEQGKEIFAVPGFPWDVRSRGTNALIKQGAHILESAEDILHVFEGMYTSQKTMLSPMKKEKNIIPQAQHDGKYDDRIDQTISSALESSLKTMSKNHSIHDMILSFLSTTPISLDALLNEMTTYPHAQVLDALTHLEIDDFIQRDNAGYIFLN